MQLKKIILYGFKSFADKTEFDFNDGITVVVGPNGCGKSNIVDAFRWVLGEQSAKSLRGGQMLDVIFNGASNRKSMGVAEVTLVFANSQGLLNTDMEEVSVTRKLYRSGESDYLLNNKSCRLKDIRDMFLGTGVGADAYSIIEQGKVEILLQSSKQDRRAIFEEAAGISKYKARKKEALRKLERTEQNVMRIQDIISELEKRLRSIKYQAGKARNYQAYTRRLNELRLNQFLAELYKLNHNAGQLQSRFTRSQDELVRITTSLEKIQIRLTELEHELDHCNDEIRQTDNQMLQFTSQIGTQEDRIEMGHRRCEELEQFLEKNCRQLQTLRNQSQILKQEIALDQEQIENAQVQLGKQQDNLKTMQDARQELALQLNEVRAQLDDEKSGLIDIVRRTAQIHNEIQSLDLRRDNLSGQKNRLNDRYSKIKEEIEDYLSRRSQLDIRRADICTLMDESQAQLNNKREQLAHLNDERLVCNENLAAAREYRSG
ncbi:MAG: AAA family ATPase, partial [Sedimentisphaerales bacterium]|nr:AAA family ATPase [Sedimentisphaerales bacterium]